MVSTVTDAPGVTRALAERGASLTYEDLPDNVIAMARNCILDSIGCGVFASTLPWSGSVRRVVESLSPAPTSSVWGHTLRADPLGAAMINGTACQGFELDDCHDQSMSHYGAAVVPAVIAMAEQMGNVDGKQLILAVTVGYELGARIGNSVSPGVFNRGFHPCGLTGTFGAAAAVAKLLDLDTDGFVNALGLAGSQAAGLMASQYGAMAKRFHSGKAAHSGILAALAAKEGLTGVRNVMEAPYGGFASTYAESYDLSRAVAGLDTEFEILRNGFKRYSSLASSQTSVDALRAMIEKHGVHGSDVADVHIATTSMVHLHCGWPYEPAETITAQMNLPYTAAVTLLEGNAFVEQYTDDKLRDPTILDLARRVRVEVDPELDALGPDEMRAVRVTVTLRDGTTYQESVLYRSGHHKNPLSDDALAEKFRGLTKGILTEEASEGIQATVQDLELVPSPATVIGNYCQTLEARGGSQE